MMNNINETIDILNSSLSKKAKNAILTTDDLVVIDKSVLLRCLVILKHKLGFTQLVDLTVVDNLNLEYVDLSPYRFSVFYILRNYKENNTLIVESRLTQNEKANSIIEVYNNAGWYEREVHEMFGIQFKKYASFKPLLRHDIFDIFPLKKT